MATAAARTVHIVTLDADVPVPSVRGARGLYSTIFQQLLEAAAARLYASPPFAHQPKPQLTWSAYDVVRGDFPPLDDDDVASSPPIDAVIVTGAAAGAYDADEWIARTAAWLRAARARYPDARFFGSCFGHQLLCQELLRPHGGFVERHPGGWELGVHPIRLGAAFLKAFPVDVAALPSARKAPPSPGEGPSSPPSMRLQFVHADHVVLPRKAGVGEVLPPAWSVLGSTDNCHVQGVYEPGKLLTLQGHFEFDRFVNAETVKVFGAKWEKDFMEETLLAIDSDDDAEWAAELVMAFFLGLGEDRRTVGEGETVIQGGLMTPPEEVA